MNKSAFAWGRQAALDLDKVRAAAGLDKARVMLTPQPLLALDALLADRKHRLTGYQSGAYAQRFEDTVRDLAALEKSTLGTERVAREIVVSLYKLMAYKDEYEVARLHAESGFFERIAREFEGDYKLHFHLAPPLLAKRDAKGHLLKKSYGPWVATAFRWLAKAKRLRGTPFDIFGYTQERRTERALIARYVEQMRQALTSARPDQMATVLELARLPQAMRGYGHVKEANIQAAQTREAYLLGELGKPMVGSAGPAQTAQVELT
jgi:indolepyruvate ferredoxin oxidoreductase